MKKSTAFILTLLTCSIAPVAKAAIRPTDVVINHLGEPAVLECAPTEPETELTWFKGGKEIIIDEENTNIVIDQSNSSLRILHVGRDDVGPYVCQEGEDLEATVTLFAAPYARTEKSINLNKGNTLTLECYAWGYPLPVVTWYGNGEPIITDPVRVLVENSTSIQNGQLVINGVQFTDYKRYTCSASNPHGVYNSTTLVRVKTPIEGIWPIIGIVIQLAIVGIIIFFYERSQKKKAAEKKE